MRLWTWQKKGFDITDPEMVVDSRRYSAYYDDPSLPGVKEAYEELWRRLEITQIIWCYTQEDEAKDIWKGHVRWELDVDKGDVLAFLSASAWNKIIGVKEFTPPIGLWLQWKREALKRTPSDPHCRDRIIEELKRAYWAPEPVQQLWKRLWLEDVSDDTWALLKHPIEKSWVVNR